MIKDEDLKQAIDYSEGQKTAAYMILGEIVNLLSDFSDNLRIIGGWVLTLLYPEKYFTFVKTVWVQGVAYDKAG